MDCMNGTMVDQKELAHASPEGGNEDKVNISDEKGEEAMETVTELNNHEDRVADSLNNESTLNEDINSLNDEDRELNEDDESEDTDKTSLEHSQSTINCKINENNIENNSDSENESEKMDIQSNTELNIGQTNELSIEETCKKDLILQNGNAIVPSKNGVSYFFFIKSINK